MRNKERAEKLPGVMAGAAVTAGLTMGMLPASMLVGLYAVGPLLLAAPAAVAGLYLQKPAEKLLNKWTQRNKHK